MSKNYPWYPWWMWPLVALLFACMTVPTYLAFNTGEWRWLAITVVAIMIYRAG